MMKNTVKTRVRIFGDKVLLQSLQNIKFQTHYSCIATICVDSVTKLEKENYPKLNSN